MKYKNITHCDYGKDGKLKRINTWKWHGNSRTVKMGFWKYGNIKVQRYEYRIIKYDDNKM